MCAQLKSFRYETRTAAITAFIILPYSIVLYCNRVCICVCVCASIHNTFITCISYRRNRSTVPSTRLQMNTMIYVNLCSSVSCIYPPLCKLEWSLNYYARIDECRWMNEKSIRTPVIYVAWFSILFSARSKDYFSFFFRP